MDFSILPECYVDTNLLETIVPPVKGYNHQKGCATVAKKMKEKFSNSFALGIIDKDKNQIKYLEEFEVWVDTESLILHKHQQKPHYIIQIVPAIEKFIIKCAQECKVEFQDFNLPASFKDFTHYSKQISSKNDVKFKQFFSAIKASPDLLILKDWVLLLKENPYHADKTTLQQIASKQQFTSSAKT